MAYMIAQRDTQALSVGDIVKAVDSNYAMRLFKKTFDMTVVEYITKQRVSHAQRLLATTDLKIAANSSRDTSEHGAIDEIGPRTEMERHTAGSSLDRGVIA